MDDFVKSQGLPFLAHLLRRLSDELVRGFDEWYPETGMIAPARTRSTILALSQYGSLSVTQLAATLRQSHPLVINWVRQLKALGLVRARADPADGRRTVLSLTPAGEAEARKNALSRDVGARAYRALMKEADADVFDALWRLEEACRRQPFADRLRQAQRAKPGTGKSAAKP